MRNGRQDPPRVSPELKLLEGWKPFLEPGEEIQTSFRAVRGAPKGMIQTCAYVLVTGSSILVIRYRFMSMKPRGVLYRLPRTTRLGPVNRDTPFSMLNVVPESSEGHLNIWVSHRHYDLVDEIDADAS